MKLPGSAKFFWVYLAALGLAALAAAWYATSTYGAGVSTDAAIQLSTADHLLSGRGFYDYTGKPFVSWPPLYPLTLAILSGLSGLDTYTAGWCLNLLLLGVCVWLGGSLLYACFKDKSPWPYLGVLVMASSVSLISVSANIGTDPLFISLVLLFLIAADRYLQTRSPGSLTALAAVAGLGALQRLPGVSLGAAGIVLVILSGRADREKTLGKVLFFSALAFLPFVSWVIFHNYLQAQTLFGPRVIAQIHVLENLRNLFEKIMYWFVPRSLAARTPFLLLLAGAAVLLLAVNRRPDWLRLGRRLVAPPVLPGLIFTGLYSLFLIFTVNTLDTDVIFYDRYQVVLLAPALIVLFTAAQELALTHLEGRTRLARFLLLAAFAAWSIYPLYASYKYARQSHLEGEIRYNQYNTRLLRQSAIVKRLIDLGKEDGATIYSNYQALAWFYTRRDVTPSPRGPADDDINVAELLQANQGWPGDKPGYLVWFLPNTYRHVLEPGDLARLADMELLYKGRDGELYRVIGRK